MNDVVARIVKQVKHGDTVLTAVVETTEYEENSFITMMRIYSSEGWVTAREASLSRDLRLQVNSLVSDYYYEKHCGCNKDVRSMSQARFKQLEEWDGILLT